MQRGMLNFQGTENWRNVRRFSSLTQSQSLCRGKLPPSVVGTGGGGCVEMYSIWREGQFVDCVGTDNDVFKVASPPLQRYLVILVSSVPAMNVAICTVQSLFAGDARRPRDGPNTVFLQTKFWHVRMFHASCVSVFLEDVQHRDGRWRRCVPPVTMILRKTVVHAVGAAVFCERDWVAVLPPVGPPLFGLGCRVATCWSVVFVGLGLPCCNLLILLVFSTTREPWSRHLWWRQGGAVGAPYLESCCSPRSVWGRSGSSCLLPLLHGVTFVSRCTWRSELLELLLHAARIVSALCVAFLAGVSLLRDAQRFCDGLRRRMHRSPYRCLTTGAHDGVDQCTSPGSLSA